MQLPDLSNEVKLLMTNEVLMTNEGIELSFTWKTVCHFEKDLVIGHLSLISLTSDTHS